MYVDSVDNQMIKATMAAKEQRSVTIHDAFVNKLRNMTTQEYLETDRSFNASG